MIDVGAVPDAGCCWLLFASGAYYDSGSDGGSDFAALSGSGSVSVDASDADADAASASHSDSDAVSVPESFLRMMLLSLIVILI